MPSESSSRQLSVAFIACLWQLAFSLPGWLYNSLLVANSDFFVCVTPQPNSGVGHRVVEVSRSHTHTQTHTHPLGPLWKSDQLVAEVAASQHGKHYRWTSLLEIGTRNPSSRAAADLRLWPHGHRDRQVVMLASSYPSLRNRPNSQRTDFYDKFSTHSDLVAKG